MEEKKQELKQNKKGKKIEVVEIDAKKESEWTSDIPSSKTDHAVLPGKMTPNMNGKKKRKTSMTSYEEDIKIEKTSEMLSDNDSPVEVSSKVEPAMIVVKTKKQKKNKNRIDKTSEMLSDNDSPVEISSKVEPAMIVVKTKKQKKNKKIKIDPVNNINKLSATNYEKNDMPEEREIKSKSLKQRERRKRLRSEKREKNQTESVKNNNVPVVNELIPKINSKIKQREKRRQLRADKGGKNQTEGVNNNEPVVNKLINSINYEKNDMAEKKDINFKSLKQREIRRRIRAEKREKKQTESVKNNNDPVVNKSINSSSQEGKLSPPKKLGNKEHKNKKNKIESVKNNNEPVIKSTNASSEKRKLSPLKQRDNKKHERRKPNSVKKSININGVEIELSYFDGFPIKKDDATSLSYLREKMISKGISKGKIKAVLKRERRKAEKALTKEKALSKQKDCYNCRKPGHVLSDCPNLKENSLQETTGTGMCFKCGSTEHTHFECKVVPSEDYKFATCFICREQGHISKQCPDNQRGLYPKGGSCKVCGDVTHLKKDCPKYQAHQKNLSI